jgi:glutamyl/glutaminyl-tRNA synthetase
LRLETGAPITYDYITTVLRANLQNYLLPHKFVQDSSYFFRNPSKYNQKTVRQSRKYLAENCLSYGDLMGEFLSKLLLTKEKDWITAVLHNFVEHNESREDRPRWMAKMKVVRLALTGGEPGPSVAETMTVLGRERSLSRLSNVKNVIDSQDDNH